MRDSLITDVSWRAALHIGEAKGARIAPRRAVGRSDARSNSQPNSPHVSPVGGRRPQGRGGADGSGGHVRASPRAHLGTGSGYTAPVVAHLSTSASSAGVAASATRVATTDARGSTGRGRVSDASLRARSPPRPQGAAAHTTDTVGGE